MHSTQIIEIVESRNQKIETLALNEAESDE